MCGLMANNKVFCSLVGVFGASVLPFAFNVFSKAYRYEVAITSKGKTEIYSDDGVGCVLERYLPSEMKNSKTVIEKIFGEDSVEESKNVSGTIVDVIGWILNMELKTVSIASKNLDKAMFCLFNIDLSKDVSLLQLQKVSSYCSRYVVILEVMAPFLACFHRLMVVKVVLKCTFPISKEASWAIKMWRAVFYLLIMDEKQYDRSME